MISRGQKAVRWIEHYCRFPGGQHMGDPVRLTPVQRQTVCRLYDDPDCMQEALTGELAAYVALLHTCGPEARRGDIRPSLDVDPWTLWRATSSRLREVLRRDGSIVRCPELGTQYPAAAGRWVCPARSFTAH
jgi:hypothetical protein